MIRRRRRRKSNRKRNLAIAAGVTGALAVGGGGLYLGRRRRNTTQPLSSPSTISTTTIAPLSGKRKSIGSSRSNASRAKLVYRSRHGNNPVTALVTSGPRKRKIIVQSPPGKMIHIPGKGRDYSPVSSNFRGERTNLVNKGVGRPMERTGKTGRLNRKKYPSPYIMPTDRIPNKYRYIGKRLKPDYMFSRNKYNTLANFYRHREKDLLGRMSGR